MVNRPFASYAIVPAAGRSQRMGQPKLLMRWRDETVIDAVLNAWQASRVDQVVVVVRPEDRVLAAHCRRSGVCVLVPSEAPAEMKHSVQLAIAHLQRICQPSDTDAWLLAPADLPELSGKLIDHVLTGYQPSAPKIVIPRVQERRGHPVLFPWGLAKELEQLGPDEGVNALVKRHAITEIDWQDDRMFEDVDTPEDYRRLSGS
ncbi:MAG: nucleotidyltransferase family protein [Planctomycetota bacterium]|nr:nucleotidyltransferase family protein [Planctomycetota bacterium]